MTLTVFPTCVGVNRELSLEGNHELRIPHVRGGEPCSGAGAGRHRQRILHVRGGEPFSSRRALSQTGVFPTCVGVNRR